MRTRFASLVSFPLLIIACSGDDTVVGDAGPEGGKDATADVAKDVANDVTVDAPKDVTVDAPQDAGVDAPAEAASDASADAIADVVDATTDVVVMDAPSDAPVDAPMDAPVDAPTDSASDAMSDAADGGGSMYHTPTCDGTVSASEYGGTQYVTTSGSQTWYVTWDATNLYVGLDAANLTEANVVYVGFSGNGYQTAQPYDSTGGTLNFLADGVVYAKSGYQESRIASSSAWGNATTNTVTFCSNGTTREEVIPWTALGATSIPSSFRFLGYATSSGGFVYGQIPTSLPSGNVGTSANWNHDFYVASTNNGSGNFPFDTTE
jgi:hypothetical protein